MFGVLLCYAPAKYLLTLWLPEYGDSAVIWLFCFPSVFLKYGIRAHLHLPESLAGQKYIMYANIITLAASVVITWLTVYVVGSIDLAAASIMILYALKTVLTELAVKKYIKIRLGLFNVQELLLTAVFMILSWFFDPLPSLAGYLLCYGIYLFAGRKRLSSAYRTMKGMIR